MLYFSTTRRSLCAQDEFKKEFAILSAVQSPHLVQFYGVQLQPMLCLVMELCERGSLFHVLSQSQKHLPRALKWSDVLEWAFEASQGIAALHHAAKPIVHRDLKSLNILVK